MKIISMIASALVLSSTMLSADISIKPGWQLLGATQDMNTSIFTDRCIDYMFVYDSSSVPGSRWQVHVANGVDYNHTLPTVSSFTKGEGYWVKGNDDCNITVAEPITHKGIIYGTIVSALTTRVWLDRNLGASQVCTAYNDPDCYGDYYQWGRVADGHEKSNSATTGTIPSFDGSFITVSTDWTTADSDGALRAAVWSKTDGTSICPVGYRVPTIVELTDEVITDSDDAYNKLKLPSAGIRFYGDGSMFGPGDFGNVWSSSVSVSSTGSAILNFSLSDGAPIDDNLRAWGFSVRCIKD